MPNSWVNQSTFNNQLAFDAPFHIIKLGELEGSLLKNCLHLKQFPDLAGYADCWLRALKKADKRASHTVPHSANGGVDEFRLADHAWIWRALRCVEKLQPRLKPHLVGSGKDYASETCQQSILARFTTKSPYSNHSGFPRGPKSEE